MREQAFIPNLYTRFLSKIDAKGFDPNECWVWRGAGKGNGYGHFNGPDGAVGAHRMAFMLFKGEIPDGMDICHTCDNRWCVNPDHLYAGTRQENMSDCVSRGRAAGGNRKHLKENQVQEVRRRLGAGMSPRLIANQMDINYATVTAIREGRSYVGIG